MRWGLHYVILKTKKYATRSYIVCEASCKGMQFINLYIFFKNILCMYEHALMYMHVHAYDVQLDTIIYWCLFIHEE